MSAARESVSAPVACEHEAPLLCQRQDTDGRFQGAADQERLDCHARVPAGGEAIARSTVPLEKGVGVNVTVDWIGLGDADRPKSVGARHLTVKFGTGFRTVQQHTQRSRPRVGACRALARYAPAVRTMLIEAARLHEDAEMLEPEGLGGLSLARRHGGRRRRRFGQPWLRHPGRLQPRGSSCSLTQADTWLAGAEVGVGAGQVGGERWVQASRQL